MKPWKAIKIAKLKKKYGGIMLDVGCGERKQQNFIGIDKRNIKGVDIVHDIEKFPWPLKNNICLTIVMSHILEHIKPWLSLDFMNEAWRVLKPGGQIAIACPYGVSEFYIQDPTHCNPINETFFQYFDPMYPLWKIYEPKPFEIEKGWPQYQIPGMLECVIRKIDEPINKYMERKLEEIKKLEEANNAKQIGK